MTKPSKAIQMELDNFMTGLIRRNPGEKEFHQAVLEVAESLVPFIQDHQEYHLGEKCCQSQGTYLSCTESQGLG